MKKLLALYIFLITSLCLKANTYYFSSSLGDDSRTQAQAQNQATPWKTLQRLQNAFNNVGYTTNNGDKFLLRNGDVFDGQLVLNRSGSSTSPMYVGTYDAGDPPIINGTETISGTWTLYSTGIWVNSQPLTSTDPNVVTINDIKQPFSRYPDVSDGNGGWAKISSLSGSGPYTWSDATLPTKISGSVKDAGVTIRANHYWMRDGTVTAHTAGSSTLTASFSQDSPNSGWGYFLTNSLLFLNKKGEWYVDPTTKKLYMYYGSTSPAGNIVKAAKYSNGISASSDSYITIDGLQFQGSISDMASFSGCTHIIIRNCNIYNAGQVGVHFSTGNNNSVISCDIENSNDMGVWIKGSSSGLIDHNTIYNSAVNSEMGSHGNGHGCGVMMEGGTGIVSYNDVEHTGHAGIYIKEADITVKYNYIADASRVTDDIGAIYSVEGAKLTTPRHCVVWGNIMDATGTRYSYYGTNETKSGVYTSGIYLDNFCNGWDVEYNTVIGWNLGIFPHHAANITIKHNNIYNALLTGIYFSNEAGTYTVNDVATYNDILMSAGSGNYFVTIISTEMGSSLDKTGLFDYNKYFNTNITSTVKPFQLQESSTYASTSTYTYSGWRTHTPSWNINSTNTPPTGTVAGNYDIKFNRTEEKVSIRLGGKKYKGTNNVIYDDTLTLDPYDSRMLMYVGLSSNSTTPPPNIAPNITLNAPVASASYTEPASISFDATATDADGSILNVKFYNGSNVLYTATPSTGYTYTWNNVAAGSYTLYAIATDNNGATKQSASVVVTVNKAQVVVPPPPPPVNPPSTGESIRLRYKKILINNQ